MMVSVTLILVTAAFSFIFYFLLKKESHRIRQNLPPGPRGLPILGSLLSLSRRPYLQFGEWVKDYGDVMLVKLFTMNMVVISDANIAREAFNNPMLTGKPDMAIFKQFSGGDYGILSTQGKGWVEQRRFALRNLRDFGFGKSSMEDLIMDEVIEFMDWLKSQEGKSITLNRKFTLAVVNSLCMIMNGKRYRQTDEHLNQLLESMIKAFSDTSESAWALFVPNFVHLFPGLTGWTKMVESVGKFRNFIASEINANRLEFVVQDNPKHFTDSYLKAVATSIDEKSTFYKEKGDENLKSTIGDLFGAGSETTSQTLSWAFLFLTTWPQIQAKVQEELDSIVGQTRKVNLDDRKNLPFVQAVILETLRTSSLAPLGVFHSAMEDTTLGKYKIPKGSVIAINQHFIHQNEENWTNPNQFQPERFLSSDGTQVLKNECLIPFSVGRRVCVGESLARDEIFLFLTNILQKFVVELDPNLPKPSLEPSSSLFLFPEIFHVILKERTVAI